MINLCYQSIQLQVSFLFQQKFTFNAYTHKIKLVSIIILSKYFEGNKLI